MTRPCSQTRIQGSWIQCYSQTHLNLSNVSLILKLILKILFSGQLLQLDSRPLGISLHKDLTLGVSIFGSVRFSPKKLTNPICLFIFKWKPKSNQNRFKPTIFSSVNWKEKPEKTDFILAKHIKQVFWIRKPKRTRFKWKFEKNIYHNIHYSNRNMNGKSTFL